MNAVLEVKNVSKYLEREVWNRNQRSIQSFSLKNFDFTIEPGYIVGMIGCNGSGKTTLIHTILGVFQPDEGEIIVDGHDRKQEAYEAKQEIAFVTDEMIFPIGMTAVDIGKCFGPCYRAFDYKKYISLCERFQIPLKKIMKKLSTGMKIKVQLAFAMARDAKLYVFDEPSAGLDPVFRRELMDYFFEIVADGDKSILLSTHLTEEMDRIADYITYIEKGKELFSVDIETLHDTYRIVQGETYKLRLLRKEDVIYLEEGKYMSKALIRYYPKHPYDSVLTLTVPTIEELMYFMTKRGKKEKKYAGKSVM